MKYTLISTNNFKKKEQPYFKAWINKFIITAPQSVTKYTAASNKRSFHTNHFISAFLFIVSITLSLAYLFKIPTLKELVNELRVDCNSTILADIELNEILKQIDAINKEITVSVQMKSINISSRYDFMPLLKKKHELNLNFKNTIETKCKYFVAKTQESIFLYWSGILTISYYLLQPIMLFAAFYFLKKLSVALFCFNIIVLYVISVQPLKPSITVIMFLSPRG